MDMTEKQMKQIVKDGFGELGQAGSGPKPAPGKKKIQSNIFDHAGSLGSLDVAFAVSVGEDLLCALRRHARPHAAGHGPRGLRRCHQPRRASG